ncbi:MAG: helix-turn-helix domain-containing protein [Candidatus Anstonellales archaeon]
MRIQIVYCGFSEAALISARKIGGDKIYIIHTKEEKSRAIKSRIESELNGISHEVDAYDIQKNYEKLHEIHSDIIKNYGEEKSLEVIINITGATKFALIAAFAFAQFLYLVKKINIKKKCNEHYLIDKEILEREAVNFVYLEEATQNIVNVPFMFFFHINEVFMKISNIHKITFKGKKPFLQNDIVAYLKDHDEVELIELQKRLKKSKSTIINAINTLLNTGLISKEKKGVKVVYMVNKKAFELLKTLEKVYNLEPIEKQSK